MFACSPLQIQTSNTVVTSAYATPESYFFDAVRKNSIISVMRLIEEKTVDINTRDRYGWTGFMYAARYGHEGLIEYFLTKKIRHPFLAILFVPFIIVIIPHIVI